MKEPPKTHDSSRCGRSNRKVVTSLALVFSMLSSCSDPSVAVGEAIPRVKVFVVGKQASGQSRSLSGRVEAADKSDLSFGVDGQVAEIIVGSGQSVIEGQLLARLDPEPLRLRLEQARADVNTARASKVEAQASYDRISRLVEQRGASRQELDAATASLAQADNGLKSAQALLDQADLDLARTRLTAPFEGQVVEIPIDPFQEITANTTAIVLQAAGSLEVEVRVPETLVRDVDFGQAVQLTFPSLEGVTVGGVVTKIGADAESGSGFPVTVRLAATESDVRPGITASVTFNFSAYLGGRIAYLIPLSAIAIDAGLLATRERDADQGESADVPIYVYDSSSGTVRLRQVKVGDLRGNEVEVFEGLSPGEQVVSAGVTFLRDGMKAEVWSPR